MSRVLPSWRNSAIDTGLHLDAACEISSSVVTMGPNGQKVSKPLLRVHWPSMFCRSRAVTSLTTV